MATISYILHTQIKDQRIHWGIVYYRVDTCGRGVISGHKGVVVEVPPPPVACYKHNFYSFIHVRHLEWLIKTTALTCIVAEEAKETFSIVNKEFKRPLFVQVKNPMECSALCSDAAFCWSRTAPPARAEMARKPRGHGTAFSWRWVFPFECIIILW